MQAFNALHVRVRMHAYAPGATCVSYYLNIDVLNVESAPDGSMRTRSAQDVRELLNEANGNEKELFVGNLRPYARCQGLPC